MSKIDIIGDEELLESHPITQMLYGHGVPPDYLKTVHLRPDFGMPFSLWPLRSTGSLFVLDAGIIGLLKAYATLKWLYLDKPPLSAHREAAHEAINAVFVAPHVELGFKTSRLQSERAKKPRGKIVGSGATVKDVVRRIVSLNPGEEWSVYWRFFYQRLMDECLLPVEDRSDDKNWVIYYGVGSKPAHMTSRRFKNILSEVR